MKKILISVILALVLVIGISSAAFAADPVVDVTAVSPGGGTVTITTTGIDTSTWHPGATGQTNTFTAVGAFNATYKSYAGNYGSLSSYVNATGAASFQMTDAHDFNILSANHHNNTVGTFTAIAEGPNAAMNLKSVGSMYVWSEATNPYSSPALQGTHIAKQYSMNTNSSLTATMFIEAFATNSIGISNSNIWGFGASESGNIYTNYGGGTRTLTASGSGTYQQYVLAGSNATSSAAMLVDATPVTVSTSMPLGGSFNIIANFVNSFSANPYSITAK